MHVLRYSEAIAKIAPTASGSDGAKAVRRRRQLGELKLFAGCSARDLATIDALSTGVSVRAGRVLCQEGAIGREFFVIVDGSVTVQASNQPARRLGVGEGFGEMAMMERGRRVATVTANEPTELLVFSVAEFDALLVQVPDVASELVRTAAARRQMLEAYASEDATAEG